MGKVNLRDSVRRSEDARFVSGRGTYIDDIQVSDCAVGVFIRSPHAHARINGFEKSKALEHKGVLAVITGADWA